MNNQLNNKRNIISVLLVDLQRSLFSVRFFVAVFGYAFLLCLNIPSNIWPNDFYAVFAYAYKPGFYMFFPLCATIPYATSYLTDCSNGYIKNIIHRIDTKKYSISRCIVVALSGFLAIILATVIFIVYIALRFSYVADNGVDYSGWDELISNGHGIEYILIKMLMTAICGSTFSIIALTVSLKIKNTFFILAFPTILYYAWNEITFIASVPLAFDLVSLLNVPLFSSYKFSISYYLIFMILLIVITIKCFENGIRRLTENGYY
jgi:hypothetical protein